MQLEKERNILESLGIKLAGITYDAEDKLAAFHAESELGFPLLQDVDAQHVKAFGILNEQYEPGDRAYGIPHPGIFFVRPDGTIAAKFAEPGYKKRPEPAEVLGSLRKLI